MDIRSALDKLIVIQAGLSITAPINLDVGKAYKYFPPAKEALPNDPCWMNEWTLASVERFIDLRVQNFIVHSQLFVNDPDLDRAADIASAFMDAFLTKLDADITLGQSVTQHNLRGGNPTLGSLKRGNQTYMGLDLFLDLEMKEAVGFS